MKKYRVTVELITITEVQCKTREEAKQLAIKESLSVPNVISKQILSVCKDNSKCDKSI